MKLKLLSFVFLASCVSTNSTPIAREQSLKLPSNAYIVYNDGGGETQRYRERALRLSKAKKRVVLKGPCGSACTILLQSRYDLDVCAMRGSTLLFHMPYFIYKSNGKMILSEEAISNSEKLWQKEWLGQFSPTLNYILEHATNAGRVPNPSRTGDPDTTLSFPATLAFKEC